MLSLLALLALLVLPAPSQAQACNPAALGKALAEASPVQAGALFVELAACDVPAARKVVGKELLRVVPGTDGDAAAVAAVEIGATDVLLRWMAGMEPKDRARTISALGEACESRPPVREFLLSGRDRLGEAFWTDRWFRALSRCQGPEVGALLATELDRPPGPDRTRFLGLLEVYARSQGPAAIPKLKELAGKHGDVETLTYIVQAFADAARVGTAGARPEDVAAAAAALVELGPSLPPKVVDAARVALQSMGAEAQADGLAMERWRERRQADGSLLWGAVVVETSPCKKGSQTWRNIHPVLLRDPGGIWVDQLAARAQARVEPALGLSLGKKCKAEASLDWRFPKEPFADEAAWQAWRAEQLKAIEEKVVDRSAVLEHPRLDL